MNATEDKIIDARNDFNEEKDESAMNLVDQIVNILKRNQFQTQVIEIFTSNLDIRDALNKNPGIQRFLINRFWRFQLVSLTTDKGVNTVDSRFALIEDGSLLTWLELFEYNVLPTIKSNGLPRY